MGRIRDAYEIKFRKLLGNFRARKIDQGTLWLVHRAEALSSSRHIPFPQALTEVYMNALKQRERWQARVASRHSKPPVSGNSNVRFVCDVGLGGLSRWLRAAGYEAYWWEHLDDPEVIRRAIDLSSFLLTTDSLLMDRRIVKNGEVQATWVPPTLRMAEQLELVLAELHLPLLPPRCMSCGGELITVDKESVRERIPPRTFLWRNDYFVCSRCNKLFWYGTHWNRIKMRLHNAHPFSQSGDPIMNSSEPQS